MKKYGKHITLKTLGIIVLMLSVILRGCGQKEANIPKDPVPVTEYTKDLSLDETTVETVADSQDEKQEKNRVIALSKSNAELWILAGGELIATSDDALEIEGLNEDVENLGDMDHVSLEVVAALEPDLVICFSTDPAQKALGESLESIGIEVLYTNIDNFDDYAEVMKELTSYTKREDLYKSNVEDVREKIDEVISRVEKDGEEKTYLLLHASATKIKAEKNDYFASEIFNNLGLKNIADDNSALNDLSLEAIVSANPDYIFVVPRGSEEKAIASFEESFSSLPAWSTLDAVKNSRFYILSKDRFGLKPNAAWGEVYEEAYNLLYQ